MKSLIAICAVVMLFGPSYTEADTWTILDMPGANGTSPQGISGDKVVGYYSVVESGHHGFLYNVTTKNWRTIDKPGAETYLFDIDDSNIVGCYWDGIDKNSWGGVVPKQDVPTSYSPFGHIHSFFYNMINNTWTELDMPGAIEGSTIATGISGNNIVGYYEDKSGNHQKHGFLYNGISWTSLDMPTVGVEKNDTYPMGINANHIVGFFYSSAYNYHGFLYNISSQKWTILDMPKGATMPEAFRLNMNVKPEDKLVAFPQSVSGSKVVGYYSGNSGPGAFIYDMTSPKWNIIGQPGVKIHNITENTNPQGIDNNNIVGTYYEPSGNRHQHGFLIIDWSVKPIVVYKEGDTVSVGNVFYTISQSVWSNHLKIINTSFNKKPIEMFLFVELTVRNDDEKFQRIQPLKLIDENGTEYKTIEETGLAEGSIGSLYNFNLNPKIQKRGYIVFDVPTNHKYKLKVSELTGENTLIVLSPKSAQ